MNQERGIIIAIGNEERVSDKFRKKRFVIQTAGQYPQTIEFEAVNSTCDTLTVFKVGSDVNIVFELRGRKWQKTPTDEVKYFNSVVAQSITLAGNDSTIQEPLGATQSSGNGTANLQPTEQDVGLPF